MSEHLLRKATRKEASEAQKHPRPDKKILGDVSLACKAPKALLKADDPLRERILEDTPPPEGVTVKLGIASHSSRHRPWEDWEVSGNSPRSTSQPRTNCSEEHPNTPKTPNCSEEHPNTTKFAGPPEVGV